MKTGSLAQIKSKLRTLTVSDYVLYGGFIAIIALIFRLYANIDERPGDWNAYKTEHHCEMGGTETVTQRATWVCDDGKVHYRWRQIR